MHRAQWLPEEGASKLAVEDEWRSSIAQGSESFLGGVIICAEADSSPMRKSECVERTCRGRLVLTLREVLQLI